jgi:hypothetical protein
MSPGAVTVCFTPGGNCTDLIVKTLGDAKSSIDGEIVITGSFNFTRAA